VDEVAVRRAPATRHQPDAQGNTRELERAISVQDAFVREQAQDSGAICRELSHREHGIDCAHDELQPTAHRVVVDSPADADLDAVGDFDAGRLAQHAVHVGACVAEQRNTQDRVHTVAHVVLLDELEVCMPVLRAVELLDLAAHPHGARELTDDRAGDRLVQLADRIGDLVTGIGLEPELLATQDPQTLKPYCFASFSAFVRGSFAMLDGLDSIVSMPFLNAARSFLILPLSAAGGASALMPSYSWRKTGTAFCANSSTVAASGCSLGPRLPKYCCWSCWSRSLPCRQMSSPTLMNCFFVSGLRS